MARAFDTPRHDALRDSLSKSARRRAYAKLISQRGSNAGIAPATGWMSDEKAESESAHSCDTCAH
jgi:hypothetical protein